MNRQVYEPNVFNLRKGHFRKGWKPGKLVSVSSIKGLQLLSFASTGESVHTAYEFNLIMNDATRKHVISHGDRQSLRKNVETIGQLLNKPVWDGIRK